MIPIVMTADDSYIIQMAVTIYSLKKNSSISEKIEITILCDSDFKEDNKKWLKEIIASLKNVKINFCVVDSERFEYVKGIGHVSLCSYYRLLIPEIIDKDSCLFLDADLIVQSDIKELIEIELDDYYLAAAIDVGFVVDPDLAAWHAKKDHFENLEEYFNAGVMLLNLKKMREDKIVESFFAELIHNYFYMDQDVLNKVCKGNVKIISPRFNCFHKISQNRCYRFKESGNPVIIHYAGPYKPWNNIRVRYADLWWAYAKEVLEGDEYERAKRNAINKTDKLDWNYIIQRCKVAEEIVIVGYSLIGVRVHDCLRMAGINAEIVFCDSSPKKHGLNNEPVYYFQDIVDIKKNALWLITSQNYYEDICKELKGLGINVQRIIRYFDKQERYYDYVDESFLNFEIEDKKIMLLGDAYEI